MNKTTLTASALVIGVAIVATYKWQTYLNDLAGRFPDLDRKVIRKAYRQFLKNAANDVYGPMQDFSDEKMDALFLAIVQEHPLRK